MMLLVYQLRSLYECRWWKEWETLDDLIETESALISYLSRSKETIWISFKDTEIHIPIDVPREDLQSAFGGPMKIITSGSTISYKLSSNH